MPRAEDIVGPLRRRLDPSSRLGLPAHITVLYPFAPPASISAPSEQRLSAFFTSVEPFDFALSDVGWFDARVMYLTPTPPAPFVDLTARIAADFPDRPPYKGAFDKIVPHLTVGEDARPPRMRRAARRLRQQLPLMATASEVWLMAPDPSGHWQVWRKFPLGTSRRTS